MERCGEVILGNDMVEPDGEIPMLLILVELIEPTLCRKSSGDVEED